MELTREAARRAPDERDLGSACLVPKDRILRFQADKLHAIRRTDKQRWSDNLPRVQRLMEWVAGDVQTMDYLVRLADGSVVCPMLIAWKDLATNDLYATVRFQPPGRKIGQREVTKSFIDMCEAWGVPSNLYLDNGKEYAHLDLADDMMALKAHNMNYSDDADAARERHGVLHSTPHQPQGKIIEGDFSNAVNQIMCSLTGFIGGDRMNKRTSALGKPPVPFGGTPEQFGACVDAALAYYRQKPQGGHLDGKSPNQARQARIDAGDAVIMLDRYQLDMVFSREHRRKVRSNGVRVGNQWYWHEALATGALIGQSVKAMVPIAGDGSRVYVFTMEGAPLAAAERSRVYEQRGTAGQTERKRRERAIIERLEATKLDYEPDRAAVWRAAAAVDPLPDDPPVAGVISVDPGYAKLAADARRRDERTPAVAACGRRVRARIAGAEERGPRKVGGGRVRAMTDLLNAKLIARLIDACHAHGFMGVVAGDSGAGKTTAATGYASGRGNLHYCRMRARTTPWMW